MKRMLLVLSLMCGLALPAAASDGRVAAAVPPGSLWDTQWGPLKDGLAAAGLDMEYYLNGELGGELELVNSLRRNRLQMVGVSLASLAATLPEVSVALAPYQFSGPDEIEFVYNDYLFPALKEVALKKNMVFLAWNEVGWSHLYSNTPLSSPDDIKGLSMRAPQNIPHQAFLTAVGADNVAIGLPDIVPALQTGMIDGGMANVILHTAMSAAYAEHYTLTAHIYDTSVFLAHKRWYDGLTEDQRTALSNVFSDQVLGREFVRSQAQEILNALKAREDITVREPSEAEMAAWREAAASAVPAIIEAIGGDAQFVQDAVDRGRSAYRSLNGG